MTSHLEVLAPDNEWHEVKVLQPGQTSTFTNYLPANLEELYIFSCAPDDSHTTILRKKNPGQTRLSRDRTFVPLSYPDEQVAELHDGQEYSLPIISQGGQQVEVRVIHRGVDKE